jgi:hypothetical protein
MNKPQEKTKNTEFFSVKNSNCLTVVPRALACGLGGRHPATSELKVAS